MTPLTWVLSGLSAVVLVGALARLLHGRGARRPTHPRTRVELVATTDPAIAVTLVDRVAGEIEHALEDVCPAEGAGRTTDEARGEGDDDRT
ncbi:hypothetical protein [Cellulomonas sp. Y8]|uniref:hypothetical protein n=1 Tax=Cellulomonas sp. Y8 TaxID=2591145 RepID=UPI003D743039